MSDLDSIRTIVQRNCDISDARHARDYTMCIYLLKMREYFRWEKGYALTDKLPSGDLGTWVEERESLWRQMGEREFDCLPVGNRCVDPYDTDAVNEHLLPRGYAYSAGLGRFVKPHFFLGRLVDQRTLNGFRVLITEDELARDLSAPPAMLRERTIYVRRDSLRRLLWERVEEWRWRKSPDDAMGRCVRCYEFDADPVLALERMTGNEVESAVLHELGEGEAGRHLGDGWHLLLQEVAQTRVEILARAVRDLIADCAVTLPALLQPGREASVHFFFANFRAMRRELFPALYAAYHRWVEYCQPDELLALATSGLAHWQRVASALLEQPRTDATALARLAEFVEQQKLVEQGE